MKKYSYPNRKISPKNAFSQKTFDIATANLMSWRQSPGAFGGLHLHACWGTQGALTRRYQGRTIVVNWILLKGVMAIFDRSGEERWRSLAEDIVSDILYLQSPQGGFYHASAEFEPTYTCEESCPIHQGLPLLALLDYVSWPMANPRSRDLIKGALDAHWEWFRRHWWRRGSDERGRALDHAGFCGVTNQDLVIVAVLARYAQVFGNAERYEEFGRPTLETYLSPIYYHQRLGLFERGPDGNFVERTPYYDIILQMLKIVHDVMPDPRISEAIDNVSRHLFDTLHIGKDGLTHAAWGAELDYQGEPKVKNWIQHPYTMSGYPGLLEMMHEYLERRPDPKLQIQYEALEQTLASYVFADGSIPVALHGEPLFAVVGGALPVWSYLVRRLGDQLKAPAPVALQQIQRNYRSLTWRSNQRMWLIEKDGARVFGGLKENPSGIVIGPKEEIAGADFSKLLAAEPDVVEEVVME